MHHPTLSTGWRALLAADRGRRRERGATLRRPPPPHPPPTASSSTPPRPPSTACRPSVLLGVSYLESRWDTQRRHAEHQRRLRPDAPDRRAHGRSARRAAHHDAGAEDPRGDDSRPARCPHPGRPTAARAGAAAALQTVDAAAAADRRDRRGAAHRRRRPTSAGGAALLAAYQRELGAPVGAGTDPAAWYGAVARYSGADSADAAAAFADEVYATIGARRDPGDRRRPAGHPAGRARCGPSAPGWTGWACAGWPARTGSSARAPSPASGSRRPTRRSATATTATTTSPTGPHGRRSSTSSSTTPRRAGRRP